MRFGTCGCKLGNSPESTMGNLRPDRFAAVEFSCSQTFRRFQQVELAGTTSFVGGSLAYVQLASSAIRLRSLPRAVSPLALRAIYLTSHRKRSRKVLFSSEPADAPEFAARHRARSAPDLGW